MKNLIVLSFFLIVSYVSLGQTQAYNHPKNGYGATMLFEGNYGSEGPSYVHNWWGTHASTPGAGVFKQVLNDNFTWIGISGIGAFAWNAIPIWVELDQAYNYSLTNNFKLRGNFGPGYFTPTWITGSNAVRQKKYLNRITEILARYPETDEWNFCNEITGGTNLNTLLGWTNVEMVVNISKHARHVLDSLCSDAKLLTNDWGIIFADDVWSIPHRDEFIQLYVDALAQGAELDYVGAEGHFFSWGQGPPVYNNFYEKIGSWRTNAELIDSLIGLPIVLTEFDIGMPWDVISHSWYVDPALPYTDPNTGVLYNDLWDWQGAAYLSAYDTLRAIPNIHQIMSAGYDDGENSWQPWVGLLYAIQLTDTAINPKPAYLAVEPFFLDEIQLPDAMFDVVNNGVPGTRTFDAGRSIDRGGSITSYQWNFGDGNTASGSIVNYTYATAGNYTVSLIVTDNDNNVDSTSYDLTLCWDLIQTDYDTIALGDSVLWNGSFYDTAGTYYELSSLCYSSCDTILTLELTINGVLTTADLTSFDVIAYPNPTNGYVFICSKQPIKISVFSVDGSRHEITIKKFYSEYSINLSGLSKGVYLIKIDNENQAIYKKVILN